MQQHDQNIENQLQSLQPQHPQPITAAAPADLLEEIVSTSLGSLSRLSQSLNMTVRQISEWIAKPENRRDIFNLTALLNAQTELLMAQHRVSAVVRLVSLTQDEQAAPETVRRACKDLLLIRMVERARPPGQGRRGGDDMEPLPLPKPKKTLPEMEREMKDWFRGVKPQAGEP